MKKILVLDDDADILEMVKEALTYEQFEVHAVNQSKNLIVVAQAYKPDLILLDYRLGDGDGAHSVKRSKIMPCSNLFRSFSFRLMSINKPNCWATAVMRLSPNPLIWMTW